MSNAITDLYIIICFVIIPLVFMVTTLLLCVNDHYGQWGVMEIIITIMFVICVGAIGVCLGGVLCLVTGLGNVESNQLYNAVPQTFELNGVTFDYTDNRYIAINPPEGFYGRISILNTETRQGLFSCAMDKGEVFSKAMITLKNYKIDTAYTGTNQITVEVENADRYESHIYTLKSLTVRQEGTGIFAPSRAAVKVVS